MLEAREERQRDGHCYGDRMDKLQDQILPDSRLKVTTIPLEENMEPC
jgi:hypothetical protein